MPHKTITYRRADLYAQVWAEPIRNVAKRHGVSDVARTRNAGSTTVRGRGIGGLSGCGGRWNMRIQSIRSQD